MAEPLTIEEENKVIDGIGNVELYQIMKDAFGPVQMVAVLGYAALYGLTGKQTTVEARDELIKLGFAPRTVYLMYQDFRKLRRALLAARGITMREQRGGQGVNKGVPPVVWKLRGLTSEN